MTMEMNPYASPREASGAIATRPVWRTDARSGMITMVFGIVMVAFATFGLMIVALQHAMIVAMPAAPRTPNRPSVTDGMRAMHGVMSIYLPAMIVGGVIFGFSGHRVRRGSLAARRFAQTNAICGYVWVIAYTTSCYEIKDVAGPPPGFLPEPALSVLQGLSFVVGAVFAAAFPTGLLYVLSRPRIKNR